MTINTKIIYCSIAYKYILALGLVMCIISTGIGQYTTPLSFNSAPFNTHNISPMGIDDSFKHFKIHILDADRSPRVIVHKKALGVSTLEIFRLDGDVVDDTAIQTYQLTQNTNTYSLSNLDVGEYYIFKISSNKINAGSFNIQIVSDVLQEGCDIYNNKFNSIKNPRDLTNYPPNIVHSLEDCNLNCKGDSKNLSGFYSMFNSPSKFYKITNNNNLAFLNLSLESLFKKAVIVVLGNKHDKLEMIGKYASVDESLHVDYINVFGYDEIFFAISSVFGDQAEYKLTFEKLPSTNKCVDFFGEGDYLEVTNTSMGSPLSGPFQQGEEITFEYKIIDWAPIADNWLHGLTPVFGDCWDLEYIDTTIIVLDSITLDMDQLTIDQIWKEKEWTWIHADTIINPANVEVGIQNPRSWYFDNSTFGPIGPSPKFKFGKKFKNIRGSIEEPLFSKKFTLKIKEDLQCEELSDCYLGMIPTSDYLSGSYKINGCTDNGICEFETNILCCDDNIAIVNNNPEICSGETTSILLAFENQNNTNNWSWTCNALGITGELYTGEIILSLYTENNEPTQEFTFVFTNLDSKACITRLETVVIVHPNPKANAGDDRSVCIESKIRIGNDFSANVLDFKYQWIPNLKEISNPEVLVTNDQIYQLNVTSQFGCTANDEVLISSLPKPEVIVTDSIDLCLNNGEIELNAKVKSINKIVETTWTGSIEDKHSKSITINKEGIYTFKVKDENNCFTQTNTVAYFHPEEEIMDVILCESLYNEYFKSIGIDPINERVSEASNPCGSKYKFNIISDNTVDCSLEGLPLEFLDYFNKIIQHTGEISLFPNPVVDNLNIIIDYPQNSTELKVQIVNANGIIVFLNEYNIYKSTNLLTLNLSSLEVGNYHILFDYDGTIKSYNFNVIN